MNNNQSNQSNSSGKSKSSNSKSCNTQSSISNKKGFGLSNYSYADYIILSSTLSYAIAEELNDEDLDFLLIFLGQVEANLALLRTKRSYDLNKMSTQTQQDTEAIDAVVEETGSEDVFIPNLVRNKKKYKKIRKRKIKKKKA